MKIPDVVFLVLICFLFCYWSTLLSFAGTYSSVDMYSHGFLIPLISLVLLSVRREKLSTAESKPGYFAGTLALLAGLSALLIGEVGGIKVLQDLSFITTISGLVILIGGTRVFRIALVPIAYLIFMVPIWGYVTDPVHYPFQLLSAKISSHLLSFVGIPVYRTDYVLHLPNITLEVAKSCSGVNYFVSIIAIGIPLSFLFIRSNARRAVLILLSIIIAILSNSIRIGLIGIFSYFYNLGPNDNVHGPFDLFRAIMVAVTGFAFLLGGLSVLSDMKGGKGVDKEISWHNFKGLLGDLIALKPHRLAVGLSVLMLAGYGIYLNTYTVAPVPLKRELRSFPYQIDQWAGIDTVSRFDVYHRMGMNQELSRIYRGIDGEEIEVYIGYLDAQTQGRELAHYKMRKYFRTDRKIQEDTSNGSYWLNNVVSDDGLTKSTLVYWFDINGRIVNNVYMAKIYNVVDGLLYRHTNGAVVIVSTSFNGDKDIRAKTEGMKRFVSAIFPVTTQYLAPL